MRIAAVGERSKGAAGKCYQCGIGALGVSSGVPGSRQRANARAATAGQQPHNVHLMRRLAEHDAAALRGVEFLGAARAVEKVGVVLRGHHPDLAIAPAVDQRARAEVGRIEAVAVADDEMDAGTLRRDDHRGTLGERQRHRFFDQRVLAGGRCRERVRRVKRVRRRDIDRLDVAIGTKRLDRRVRAAAEIVFELLPRIGTRIRRGDQFDATIAGERRQHQHERPAEAGHTEAQRARGAHDTSPSLRLIAAARRRAPASARAKRTP